LVQRPHLHQSKWESRRRNQTILDPPRRPDEQYFSAVPFLQLLCDSERRNHVSAGPATRHNCSHDVTINRKLLGKGVAG